MRAYVVALAVLFGAYYYGTRHMDLDKLLALAKENPGAAWAPKVDYYVGIIHYQRSDYPRCQEAFTQLLTDFPTAPYARRALVRQTECATENKDWDTAKDAAARYIEEFPDGKEVQVVKKKYELLKYHHP